MTLPATSNDPTLIAREGKFEAILTYPNMSDYQYRQVKKYGLFYDFRFLRYIAAVHKHKQFRVAFDVGCCFANHAVYFGKALDCRVECFEPNTRLLKYISQNLKQAVVSHQIHNVALGDTETVGIVAENVSNLGGSRFIVPPQHNDQTPVRITTMDDVVDQHALADPCFIKIDTEGYECKVLTGATRTLQRCTPELFLEISPENKLEATALLKRHGYRLVFNYGKNYHFSKTLNASTRFILAIEAMLIDANVSLTKNSVDVQALFTSMFQHR